MGEVPTLKEDGDQSRGRRQYSVRRGGLELRRSDMDQLQRIIRGREPVPENFGAGRSGALPNSRAIQGLVPESGARKCTDNLYQLRKCQQPPPSSGDLLLLDKSQQVRIYHIGMSGHHAVRETRINFERAVLEQLGLQQ